MTGRCVNRKASLDDMLDCISENLHGAIEEMAPLKTFTPKRIRTPWIDTELQLLINKQNAQII